ncbi:hypothetical protein Avbf_14747 [Armadillidium vulgare]|nr:hypothetical protein Avbf_14747 [Armadillidium vulgare]
MKIKQFKYLLNYIMSSGMCKNLCITNKNCTVLSISFKGNKTQCQFSNVSEPIEVTIEDFSEKSFIGIKIEQLMKIQMSDGYLYWVPDGKYSYYEARIKCRTLPGFRLVMVKTQESKLVVEQLLNALSEDLWIDLVKTGNEILWGDGSPLDLGGPLKDILQATGLFNVAFLWTVNGIKDVFINSQPLYNQHIK